MRWVPDRNTFLQWVPFHAWQTNPDVGRCPSLACQGCHDGRQAFALGRQALKQSSKEEEARIRTRNLSDITYSDPETWPLAHTGHGYLLLSIKLHRLSIKLLIRSALKIPPVEPRWLCSDLECGSPWVMDIGASGHPYVGNGKITFNRINPLVPRIQNGYHRSMKSFCHSKG